MKKIKELFNQYKIYILIVIIIILIIVIGFMYSNNISNNIDTSEEKIEKVEIKKTSNKVLVDIKGEVNIPGVYELNEDERVIDVIKKANGLTDEADTSYLNLSKKVKDEMVIIIYSKKEIEDYEKSLEESKVKEIIKYEVIEKEIPCPNKTNEACTNNSNTETSKTKIEELNETDKTEENKLVDLNTATKEELLTLPGIGESKADLILEYRSTNKFTSIEDIKNVKGIGDSLFEKIKDSITV